MLSASVMVLLLNLNPRCRDLNDDDFFDGKLYFKISQNLFFFLESFETDFLLICYYFALYSVMSSKFPLVDYKLRMNCPEGKYNSMSLLCFGTPEVAVKAMFHKHWDYFHITSLLMFFPFYWCLSVITYGVSVPSGLG